MVTYLPWDIADLGMVYFTVWSALQQKLYCQTIQDVDSLQCVLLTAMWDWQDRAVMAILYSLNYYTFLMTCNMKLPEKIRSTDVTLDVLKTHLA